MQEQTYEASYQKSVSLFRLRSLLHIDGVRINNDVNLYRHPDISASGTQGAGFLKLVTKFSSDKYPFVQVIVHRVTKKKKTQEEKTLRSAISNRKVTVRRRIILLLSILSDI